MCTSEWFACVVHTAHEQRVAKRQAGKVRGGASAGQVAATKGKSHVVVTELAATLAC